MFKRPGTATRLLWEAAATRPARFLGAQRRRGRALYRWGTQFGDAVLAHTVRGEMGMTFPSHARLRGLAEDAVALAVAEPGYGPPHGPSLEAIDAAGPDGYYGTTWRRLERVLGIPAPYGHSNLRDPELMTARRPGAATLHVPAVVAPDPGPLLRPAAEEPDGSHAAVAALDTARRAVWSEAKSCQDEITGHVGTSEDPASIAVRPLLPPEPPAVAEEILRDGWRTILNRTDTLAAECARLGQVLGATRYFPGSCKVTVDPASCAQAGQWVSRLQSSPRTALATYLGNDRDQDQDILIEPITDMPAVRTSSGSIETVAPQRLPAHSPPAALTTGRGRGSVWVTTQDGTFLAPQIGGGYTYGYGSNGPMALARLIDLLLKDTPTPRPAMTHSSLRQACATPPRRAGRAAPRPAL